MSLLLRALLLSFGSIYLLAPAAWAKSTLYYNAHVYTNDPARPSAVAFVVQDQKISKVFTTANPPDPAKFNHKVDLEQQFVVPSFHDHHTHPMESGVEYSECRIYDVTTSEELKTALKQCDQKLPKNTPWLRGSGWSVFGSGLSRIHKEELDVLKVDRPIALLSSDGHSYWVDSKALQLAKIDRHTPEPENGRIGKDENGEPNGLLYEGAMTLIENVLPPRSETQLLNGILKAETLMLENGITSYKDAHVTDENLAAYVTAQKRRILQLDADLTVYVPENSEPSIFRKLRQLRRRHSKANLKVESVKIFLDGVIEDKTAALLKPYAGTSNRGDLQWQQKKLNAILDAAESSHFTVHFHTIGDAAVRAALDAVAYARVRNPQSKLRHEIAHVQLIDPADINRLRSLRVTVVFSPLWAVRDDAISKFAEPYLADERIQRLYPIGSVLRSLARIQFGSDWSVTSMNPLEGLRSAVLRHEGDESTPSWLPAETITTAEALKAYVHPQAALQEKRPANFIVLSGNPLAIHPARIAQLQVLKTYLRGKLRFQKPL